MSIKSYNDAKNIDNPHFITYEMIARVRECPCERCQKYAKELEDLKNRTKKAHEY